MKDAFDKTVDPVEMLDILRRDIARQYLVALPRKRATSSPTSSSAATTPKRRDWSPLSLLTPAEIALIETALAPVRGQADTPDDME